jgi:hypothetical protein
MAGTEGIVVQRNAKSSRLVLFVQMLGQGAAVEIDTDLLEPAEDFVPAGAVQLV